MKKTAAVFFLLFLLATAYSQVAVLQLAISDPLLFKNGMIRKGLSMQTTIRETTFSKPHTYAFAAGKSTQHPVRQGMLWGGISGAALGVTLVLAGNSDPAYRPKPGDVITFTLLGGAAGVAVGLVTGLIRSSRHNRKAAVHF